MLVRRFLQGSLLTVLLLFSVVLLASAAFIGPGSNPPTGSGAIVANGTNDIIIGTSTAISNTKLYVVGSSTTATDYAFRAVRADGTSVLIVRNDGRVGIGTLSPSAHLYVQGTFLVTGTTTFNGQTYTWPASAGSNGYALTTNGSGILSWTAVGGGSVGGSGTANYVAKFTGASTIGNSLIQDNGSNVGIGISPTYRLDVSGGDINTTGVYRKGGAAGLTQTCAVGYALTGVVVQGGIITSGTCTLVNVYQ